MNLLALQYFFIFDVHTYNEVYIGRDHMGKMASRWQWQGSIASQFRNDIFWVAISYPRHSRSFEITSGCLKWSKVFEFVGEGGIHGLCQDV